MAESEAGTLQKILHALLLVQMEELEEPNRFSILIRAGWTNGEIASSLAISENAVAVRRTRLKQKAQKEKE